MQRQGSGPRTPAGSAARAVSARRPSTPRCGGPSPLALEPLLSQEAANSSSVPPGPPQLDVISSVQSAPNLRPESRPRTARYSESRPPPAAVDSPRPRSNGLPRPSSARPVSADARPCSARPLSADVLMRANRLTMEDGKAHPRSGSRGGSARPQSARGSQQSTGDCESELLEICRHIGQKAAQKFGTVREAFRFINPNYNGKISRSDVHYFFRAYGVAGSEADRFANYLQADGSGGVDYERFVALLRPHIQPDTCAEHGLVACDTPRQQITQAMLAESVQKDFRQVLELIRVKAPQKFAHVREVLRIVDVDYDGLITREEIRHFFRSFGVLESVSDCFFERLSQGQDSVDYGAFVASVVPFLELPGSEVVMQKSCGLRPHSADRLSGGICPSLLQNGAEILVVANGPDQLLPTVQQAQDQDRVYAVQESRRTALHLGLRQHGNRPPSAGPRPSGARRPVGAGTGAPLSFGEAQALMAECRNKGGAGAAVSEGSGGPVGKAAKSSGAPNALIRDGRPVPRPKAPAAQ